MQYDIRILKSMGEAEIVNAVRAFIEGRHRPDVEEALIDMIPNVQGKLSQDGKNKVARLFLQEMDAGNIPYVVQALSRKMRLKPEDRLGWETSLKQAPYKQDMTGFLEVAQKKGLPSDMAAKYARDFLGPPKKTAGRRRSLYRKRRATRKRRTTRKH
jgi:hypothetical protein